MFGQGRSSRGIRFLIWEVVSWTFLVPGIVLLGKSAVEILGVQHVTTNFVYWSTAGLLLMLIGLLMHSCHKEFSPPNPVNSKS